MPATSASTRPATGANPDKHIPDDPRPSRTQATLGPSYHKLRLAQGVSNLGDGVDLTALPLLAATLTREPLPVSAVVFAEWLPWLLFGLVAGCWWIAGTGGG